jgi:hypothetical protein
MTGEGLNEAVRHLPLAPVPDSRTLLSHYLTEFKESVSLWPSHPGNPLMMQLISGLIHTSLHRDPDSVLISAEKLSQAAASGDSNVYVCYWTEHARHRLQPTAYLAALQLVVFPGPFTIEDVLAVVPRAVLYLHTLIAMSILQLQGNAV